MGDKVPHPAVIFLILIGIVMVLSVVFSWVGAGATFQSANVATGEIDNVTTQSGAFWMPTAFASSSPPWSPTSPTLVLSE